MSVAVVVGIEMAEPPQFGPEPVVVPLEPECAEPVCWVGGKMTTDPPLLVTVLLGLVLLEEPELDFEHVLPSRTENWVEYWNSPVPSTMISMP